MIHDIYDGGIWEGLCMCAACTMKKRIARLEAALREIADLPNCHPDNIMAIGGHTETYHTGVLNGYRRAAEIANKALPEE